MQDRAVTWLAGDEGALNAIAHALDILDPAFVTIDLEILSSHPSQWLRQIAALLATRSTPPAADVLRKLATDPDRYVRRNVGQLVSRIAAVEPALADELRLSLQDDQSWMVRKAASTYIPAEPSNP